MINNIKNFIKRKIFEYQSRNQSPITIRWNLKTIFSVIDKYGEEHFIESRKDTFNEKYLRDKIKFFKEHSKYLKKI